MAELQSGVLQAAYSQPTDRCPDSTRADHQPPKNLKYEREQPRYVYEYLWTCCNCYRHDGMSQTLDHCPECPHLRCQDCLLEVAKIRAWDLPHSRGPHRQAPELNQGRSFRLAETTQQSHRCQSAKTQNIRSVGIGQTNLAQPIPSRRHNLAFTTEKLHISRPSSAQSDLPPCCELAVTSNNSWQPTDAELYREDWCGWSSDSNSADHSPGSEDQDTDGQSPSSDQSNDLSPNASSANNGNRNTTARKRGLAPGGGEDEEGTQKRRKVEGSQAESLEQRRFACHFWKRDPQHYHDGTSKKYQSCPCPNFKEFRKIKVHFRNHLVIRCYRCGDVVTTRSAFKDHQREGCAKVSPLKHLDAIDDVKREQIDLVLKVKNGKNKTQDQKWSEDVQRWFDIWEILFPQIPQPASPYVPDNLTSAPLVESAMPNMQSMMSVVDATVLGAAGFTGTGPQGEWAESIPTRYLSDLTHPLANDPRTRSAASEGPSARDPPPGLWQSSEIQVSQAVECSWLAEFTQGVGDLDDSLTGFAFDSIQAETLPISENEHILDESISHFGGKQRSGDFTPALQDEIDREHLQPAYNFLPDSYDGNYFGES
ncbi:hypothetical protein BDZ45DRAFT_148051 [Acephala macrosclerotiorum]|nr:hypothetical protein BDZ45DRAFT_148051 [Acephala macrosclerotiorum]